MTQRASSSGADISSFADITHEVWDDGGIYRAIIKATGEEVAHMRYLVFHNDNVVRVGTTYVDPAWRGHKIATALGERLHLDYAEYYLDLGGRAEDMETPGFWEYQKKVQPDWNSHVINDGARERRS